MKRKKTLKRFGIIVTAISGTILSIVTAGVALPAVIATIAGITGAIGTGAIILDGELNKINEEENTK